MTMTTVVDRTQLRALTAAASRGPWTAGGGARLSPLVLDFPLCGVLSADGQLALALCGKDDDSQSRADAAYIAAVHPGTVTALLDELARTDALLERAWALIANAHEGDWSRSRPVWRDAAAAWRADFGAVRWNR